MTHPAMLALRVPPWLLSPLLAFTALVAQAEPAPFQPTWESLTNYHCPEWFRDAKFGIWAHWGPQSVPMAGDWYAKNMYLQSNPRGQYQHHLEHYGHPSTNGWKDIIPLWRAEKFDPDRLMGLYKEAGARYFVSLAVHHDNFDLWNSRQHRWNSVSMGPRRDIVGEWQKAAQKYGLPFGVSEHLGASFNWFQTSHRSDTNGALVGVAYDGADPKWQDLYHPPASPGDKGWYTTNPEWATEWFSRIQDLVDQYHPDLLYSDGALPFGETGRRLLTHFYNANQARHEGKLEAVYCLKDKRPRPASTHGDYVEGIGVEDVERGVLAGIKAEPWQTDTSIGDWFYNQNWKVKNTGRMYRSADWVVHTLLDTASKNGNLLLNVVLRPDGSLDAEVEQLLTQIGGWLKTNGEAIYATRPWLVYGEGPTQARGGHFKEDFAYTATDIRFTTRGKTLYATTLGWPAERQILIKSLGRPVNGNGNHIEAVELVGSPGKLQFEQTSAGLAVTLPEGEASSIACSLKITGRNLKPVNVPAKREARSARS